MALAVAGSRNGQNCLQLCDWVRTYVVTLNACPNVDILVSCERALRQEMLTYLTYQAKFRAYRREFKVVSVMAEFGRCLASLVL